MKIWIQSDQHYEIYGSPKEIVVPEADVFVCAGDLMREPAEGVRWLSHAPYPSIYVVGNHEYYRGTYTTWRDAGAAENERHENVHLLEDSTVAIGGVRFIGCTLWTDYALYGEDTIEGAKEIAWRRMNDFNLIRYAMGTPGRHWEPVPLRPNHLSNIHAASKVFLDKALSEPFDGKTVVVTHHGPHKGSIHPRYAGDILTAAFVSDLSDLIERHQPDLWIHGHVHSSFDYIVGKTRIIANPKGYYGENPDFDPNLIIEI